MVTAALAGKASLVIAVMADVLGLLFVLLNGIRPLWWKVTKKGKNLNTERLGYLKTLSKVIIETNALGYCNGTETASFRQLG